MDIAEKTSGRRIVSCHHTAVGLYEEWTESDAAGREVHSKDSNMYEC